MIKRDQILKNLSVKKEMTDDNDAWENDKNREPLFLCGNSYCKARFLINAEYCDCGQLLSWSNYT